MDTIGSRIRYARNALRLRQEDVAEALGINRVNISTWENGGTKPDIERLPRLAEILQVSESWLLSGAGKAPEQTADALSRKTKANLPKASIIPGDTLIGQGKMPLYTGAMGGDGHVIVTFEAIDFVKRPAELEYVKGGYGLLIVGESMVPAFRPGDMALVNPHLPPARNKNVILYHTPPDGGDVEAIVKELVSWNDREWYLRQYNPAKEFSEYRQEWPICHRVVGRYDAR